MKKRPGDTSNKALLCATCGVALSFFTLPARAQNGPYGLKSMQETVPAVYPPIARVAHITGTVVMMVKFEENGNVSSIRNLSGPSLLQGASDNFVRGWRANPYTGPRECPIAITFLLFGPSDKECTSDYKPTPGNAIRVDLQHVNIVHENVCVTVERDSIGKRVHRFHL